MFKKLGIIFALIFCTKAVAQVGLQLNYVAPIDVYKYTVKPTIGGELIFNFDDNEIDKRFKLSGSICFHRYKPTQDTFRIYGLQTGGTLVDSGTPVNGTALVPGWAHLYNIKVYGVGIRSEYKVLKTKLSPVIGLDFYTYLVVTNQSYDDGMVSYSGKDANDLTYTFALAPRAGLSYQIKENWLINAGFSYSWGFYSSAVPPSYCKTFINAFYYFN